MSGRKSKKNRRKPSRAIRTLTMAAGMLIAAALLAPSARAGSEPRLSRPEVGAGPARADLDRPPPPGPHPGPPPGASDRPPPGDLIERNAARLGLSKATVAKIRGIVRKSRVEDKRIRGRLDNWNREMRALLETDSPDEREVMLRADLFGRLAAEQRKNRLRAMLAIRALLSPKQRRELMRLHRERMERMEGRGVRRPPR